jgi:hypothetical protein
MKVSSDPQEKQLELESKGLGLSVGSSLQVWQAGQVNMLSSPKGTFGLTG